MRKVIDEVWSLARDLIKIRIIRHSQVFHVTFTTFSQEEIGKAFGLTSCKADDSLALMLCRAMFFKVEVLTMLNPQIVSLRLHNFYKGFMNSDSVVVDLGANRGNFSHEISQLLGCKCYAVEASPRLFETIQENALVRKFNYAVSDENKPMQFNDSTNEESGSISALPEHLSKNAATVEGITLDKFLGDRQIDSVDLMKVDIEGAEIELFKSASDETLLKIKQIAVEFHDFLDYFDMKAEIATIKQRMKSLGFYCIVYSFFSHADVLFINKKTAGISALEYLYLNYVDKYLRGIHRGISWRLEKLLAKPESPEVLTEAYVE